MAKPAGTKHGLASHLLWPAGGLLTGLLGAGLLWSWRASGDGGQYLALQAASDSVHRFSIIAAPLILLGLILCWTLSEIGRLGGWRSLTFRVLLALLMAGLTGTAGHLALFDLELERAGQLGQWVQAPTQALGPWAAAAGPWAEASIENPNLQTPTLRENLSLTLDRRSLALKTDASAFRWNRPRPGPPPAQLLLSGKRIVYAGPGARFEDDLVVMAVDLESGRKLWEFHLLGRTVLKLGIEDEQLSLLIWRPSNTRRLLLDWPQPQVIASVGEEAHGDGASRHLRKPPEPGQGTEAAQEVR